MDGQTHALNMTTEQYELCSDIKRMEDRSTVQNLQGYTKCRMLEVNHSRIERDHIFFFIARANVTCNDPPCHRVSTQLQVMKK